MNLSDSRMMRFTSLRLILLTKTSSLIRFAKMPDLEARRQRLLCDFGAMARCEAEPRLAARQERHGIVREVARHIGGGGDEHRRLVRLQHQYGTSFAGLPLAGH